MSVATSVKRYINGISPDAVESRISMDSSPSFSSSFVTSCRFWFAANSIWATLVVAAGVTAAMRLRIDKSWPFIAFVTFLSAGLFFRELWKSKLKVAPAEKLSVGRGHWRGVASAVARPTADTCDAQEAASDSDPGAIRYQAFFGRISFK